MHSIAPRTGAEEVTLATDQHEYKELVAAHYMVEYAEGMQGHALLTRWRFTSEERERIKEGADLYLACLTFGNPLQPLMLQVGPEGPTCWTVPENET